MLVPRSDFSWRALIKCYADGVFPMGDSRDDDRIFLVNPELRGVLPLERFHVPRRLARTVRADVFQVRIDSAFPAVLEGCAASRLGRHDTWINTPIRRLYGDLFANGLAHSVECWRDGLLVGGLYGVALDGAFFGESMFSEARDASKVALAHLVARLKVGGYRLLDSQFMTEHLAQFGAEEISREEYQRRLAQALGRPGDFYALPPSASGADVMAAIKAA